MSEWGTDLDIGYFRPEDKGILGGKPKSSIMNEVELDNMMRADLEVSRAVAGGTPVSTKPPVYKEPKNKPKEPAYSTSGMKSCHEDHPPLAITDSTGTYYIYGGSCIRPVINDMDVFVGLDYGMAKTSRQFPWNAGEECLFKINDMHPPDSLAEFNQLIDYLAYSLRGGKKVFVGCIGGHGRTGTVFAALVKKMTGMEDAIPYVRENYCHKAVESTSQIDWLHKHFGITKAKPTKGYGGTTTTTSASSAGTSWNWKDDPTTKDYTNSKGISKSKGGTITHRYQPVNVKGHIHGSNDLID